MSNRWKLLERPNNAAAIEPRQLNESLHERQRFRIIAPVLLGESKTWSILEKGRALLSRLLLSAHCLPVIQLAVVFGPRLLGWRELAQLPKQRQREPGDSRAINGTYLKAIKVVIMSPSLFWPSWPAFCRWLWIVVFSCFESPFRWPMDPATSTLQSLVLFSVSGLHDGTRRYSICTYIENRSGWRCAV